MLGGNVVDQFLYEHGLSYACAAEKADLAALGIRFEQVYHLDPRFEDMHRRALFAERGRAPMNAASFFRLNRAAAVDRLT